MRIDSIIADSKSFVFDSALFEISNERTTSQILVREIGTGLVQGRRCCRCEP